MKVPYINLGLQYQSDKAEILQKIEALFDSGMFILGDEVSYFERQFAELCEVKYAVGVANGTDALILALKNLGIGEGDEVITASNSYLASASSIALVGAKIVLADVRKDFNIDPESIKSKITSKTKAIIAVHLTGRPAEMDVILDIADEHGIDVIEDAAQAVGAKYKNKPVGGWGKIGCFSLHPLKNLAAAGDAGIITTDDKKVYEWLLKARTHGMKNRDECEFWSLNSRLDSLQAAILNVKVKRLEELTERRRQIAGKYNDAFKEFVVVPEENNNEYSVFHTYIIQTPKRDLLRTYLSKKGIDTKVHYPIAIHQQEAFITTQEKVVDLIETENQVKQILTLPVYPELTDRQVDYVINEVKSFFYHESV